MIKLSFNIPTYNRCQELRKNLGIIVSQIREENLIRDVEINVSDNGSTDNTAEVIKEISSKNKDIIIKYHRIENNMGPDVNFINAMKMALGEYSILYGDDDYLVEGGLNKIFSLIDNNSDAALFLSNRISINHEGKVLSYDYFLREEIESRVYDFSKQDEVRSYFSVCNFNTLGGCLSFISSVIYKTKIISEIGDVDNRFIGSNYAFMGYWWPSLLKGNKLYYCKDSYLLSTTSGATNNNYGTGLKRIIVDVKGISIVANSVFTGPNAIYKSDFLIAANRCNSYASIINGFLRHRAMGYDVLLPNLEQFGWSKNSIDELKETVSFRNLIIGLIGTILRRR